MSVPHPVAGAAADLRRDGPVGLLAVVSFGWFLTLGVRVVYPTLLPSVTAEFGVGNATAGLFVGVLWTAYALLQFPGGVLADALGERLVLAGSVALTAVAVGSVVLSTDVVGFVTATVVLGVATGLYGTTRITVVAATFDRAEATAIGVSQAAGNVGNVVLSAGAGVVGAALGWRWGFGYLLPGLGVCALALWVTVPRRSGPPADASLRETLGGVARAVRRPRVLAVTLLLSLNMVLYQSVTGFLPTYLVQRKGFAPETAALLYGGFFAAAVGLQFVSGAVADRRGNRVAVAAFVGASVPAFVALTLAAGRLSVVVAVLGLSLLLGAMPPINAAGVSALPEAIRGSGFGLLRTVYIGAGALGPPVVGTLADAGLFDGAFLLLAGVAAATSVWALLFERVGA